jgi:hypothetical protein
MRQAAARCNGLLAHLQAHSKHGSTTVSIGDSRRDMRSTFSWAAS